VAGVDGHRREALVGEPPECLSSGGSPLVGARLDPTPPRIQNLSLFRSPASPLAADRFLLAPAAQLCYKTSTECGCDMCGARDGSPLIGARETLDDMSPRLLDLRARATFECLE